MCLGFVDARAVIGEHLLALGKYARIGWRSVTARCVAVGGRVVLRRVPHLPPKRRAEETNLPLFVPFLAPSTRSLARSEAFPQVQNL